jgi:hypothetical protein
MCKSAERKYVTIFFMAYVNVLLRVFENRLLRRIFGPRKQEVAGGW